MEQQQMIDLAAKHFLGILSRKERRILDHYLSRCSENERQSFFRLVDEQRTLADLRDLYEVCPEPAADSDRPSATRVMARVVRPWRWVISSAAVLLMLFGSIILWRLRNGQENAQKGGLVQSERSSAVLEDVQRAS